jgi:hypothetical protein
MAIGVHAMRTTVGVWLVAHVAVAPRLELPFPLSRWTSMGMARTTARNN